MGFPGNNGKMTLHSSFKVSLSKWLWNIPLVFLFEFSVIRGVWLPDEIIQLRSSHCKTIKLDWPGNNEKMMLHSNFKPKFSKSSWDIVRGFYLNLVWSEKFGLQRNSSSCKLEFVRQEMVDRSKLAIEKERISDWLGNDGNYRHTATWNKFFWSALDVYRSNISN